MQMEKQTEVEFRIIDDEEEPPIVVTKNENDNAIVVLNQYHRIWISLNRALIAGIAEALPGKIRDMLNAYLKEQRAFERMDEHD